MRKGIAKKTEHEDGNGDLRCLSTYFEQQWLVECPEWYLACGHDGQARVAATKNACEAAVKYARLDAGDGVIVNLADNVAFLQRVVRSRSMDDWDPKAERDVAVALWRRAQSLLGVLRSNLVNRDNTNPAAVRYAITAAEDLGYARQTARWAHAQCSCHSRNLSPSVRSGWMM